MCAAPRYQRTSGTGAGAEGAEDRVSASVRLTQSKRSVHGSVVKRSLSLGFSFSRSTFKYQKGDRVRVMP